MSVAVSVAVSRNLSWVNTWPWTTAENMVALGLIDQLKVVVAMGKKNLKLKSPVTQTLEVLKLTEERETGDRQR